MVNSVRVTDRVTPFLARKGKDLEDKIMDAVVQSGYWLRKTIRRDIKVGAPAGRPYKPAARNLWMLIAMRGMGKKKRGGFKAPRLSRVFSGGKNGSLKERKPLGKLVNAVYVYKRRGKLQARIGWMTRSAKRLGEMHENSYRYPVTPKMRRFFFVAAMASKGAMKPLRKGKSYIEIPRRPTYQPEYLAHRKDVSDIIEKDLLKFLGKGASM